MAARQAWGLSLVLSETLAATILQLGSVLYIAGGAVAAVVAVASSGSDLLVHPGVLLGVGIVAVVAGSAQAVATTTSPRVVRRWFAALLWVQLLGTPLLISVGLVGAGPNFGAGVAFYVEVPIYSVYLLRPGAAFVTIVLATGDFGAVVLTQSGWPRPGLQMLFLFTVLWSSSFTFGELLKRGYLQNQRLSEFRRFLPESVADAVFAGGDSALFDPHRRAISVVFCDLRGFTHFAASASPEDVQAVLDAYFGVVGHQVHELGATVGSITGDGVMAYFGDPIPCEDPADRALDLVHHLRAPMDNLVAGWVDRGFELSYGIGVAHGYATLGLVGFEGRYDYTALGPVVNLAARLSDAAGPGETLIDQRTMAEATRPPHTALRSIPIKGYDQPVKVHALEIR